MQAIKVGERLPLFKHVEGVFVDVGESGVTIFFSLFEPTPKELESFTSRSSFKIRSGVIDNVLFFTLKPGSLPWSDAYWIPSNDPVRLQKAGYGQGVALTLVLIDAHTSVVKRIRLIGLGTEFSKVLKEQTDFILDYKRGDFKEGVMRAQNVQDRYSTEELMRKLKNRYETAVGGII